MSKLSAQIDANLRIANPKKTPTDQKCYDLATWFLEGSSKDTEEYRENLAILFQEVADNFGIENA